jgi:transcriptional regulator with XRE-family HTH domain
MEPWQHPQKGERGMKFKELLKKADLTEAQLARRLGITPAAVNKWCKGKSSPPYSSLREIANFLNVSVDDVVRCFL